MPTTASTYSFSLVAGLLAREQGKLSEFIGTKRQYDDIVNEELSEVQNRPIGLKQTAIIKSIS